MREGIGRIVLLGLLAVFGAGVFAGCATDGGAMDGAGAGPDAADSAAEESLTLSLAELREESAEAQALDAELAAAAAAQAAAAQAQAEEAEARRKRAAAYFSEYHIGPGDTLSFRYFDDPGLDSIVTVRYDGHISLPWIKDIKVGGLTRSAATELLREAYNEIYFEPEVSLTVTAATSQFFSVMGDVTNPAEFPYMRPITLLDSINAAGGQRLNQRGGDTFVGGQGQLVKAFIIRTIDGEREVTVHDLREIQESGPHASEAPVYPGDIVYVPEGINLVYLLGEVRQPDVFALSQGMTLMQLLANAGGFQESTARLSQVVLLREESDAEKTKVTLYNVKEMLKTGADPLLQPGDIIYVPRKRLTNLRDFVNRFTGAISPVLSLYTQTLGLYTTTFDAFHHREQFERGGFFTNTNIGAQPSVKSVPQSILDIAASASALAGNR